MKKSDGKLFNAQFVHFMWDKSLEGKEGFASDNINTLQRCVEGNNMERRYTVNGFGSENYPFETTVTSQFRFFYYDPHYKLKKAWMKGKKVQHLTTIYAKNRWEGVPDEWYWDGNDDTQYRIKPEKKWRPFKDVKEFKNAWYGKRPFDVLSTRPEEPMIWVRWKGGREHKLITGYYNKGSQVFLCDEWISLERLFEYYEFLDGTPIGVEVEE